MHGSFQCGLTQSKLVLLLESSCSTTLNYHPRIYELYSLMMMNIILVPLTMKALLRGHKRSIQRKFTSLAAMETKKMNLFTAINDGMRIAMKTDETAILFGEGSFTF